MLVAPLLLTLLGWDWKSLNASLLRAPLCGANEGQCAV